MESAMGGMRHPNSELVDDFVARYGVDLLRTARRYSASSTDAEDAYQRSLEILLTKPPAGLAGSRLKAWMVTVVRNLAIDHARHAGHIDERPFDDATAGWRHESATPEERLMDVEDFRFGKAALHLLNADQMRCLVLRADSLGYEEISEITGFSYAKVNRCLSEGRAALRARVGLLESGAECRRLLPMLSMIADGAANRSESGEARRHLEGCLACKATLREFRSAPSKFGALLPVGVLVVSPPRSAAGRMLDQLHQAFAAIQERLLGHAVPMQSAAEISAAKKTVAIAAIAAALTGGGVALEQSIPEDRGSHRSGAQNGAATRSAERPHGPTTDVRRASSRDRGNATRQQVVRRAEVIEAGGARPLPSTVDDQPDRTAADGDSADALPAAPPTIQTAPRASAPESPANDLAPEL